jgi:ribosomal protein S3
MGTKVHPKGLRLGNHINWDSTIRSDKSKYADLVHQNVQLKQLIDKTLRDFGIITGKLFIRPTKGNEVTYKIQGSYYITANSKNIFKKRPDIEGTDLNENVDFLINQYLYSLIMRYLNIVDPSMKCELDLTNVLLLGQYHTSIVANKGLKQVRGPMTRLPYTKDLFMIIHKMMLLKDSTILGKAIFPLLEKTTKHHQVVNNVENLCQLAFDQYKGLKGFRIDFKGRIGGSARSRLRTFKLGSIPAQKMSANIEYSFHEAVTRYGVCSIRIWLY